ncbi:MAG: sigma-54-dependent Fis family transcriptional regulator [Myxococcales bacterium]|nr:sigma-54-dependent Fis family transcriptional regulator [Myxococcales bacterium]
MSRASILVVDDEPNVLRSVALALRDEGFEVDTAVDGASALERASTRAYEVILLDVQLPKLTGLEVLRRLRAQHIDTPVVMMSGHGTIETAVEATRLGAQDFLEKPFASTEKLLFSVQKVLNVARLEDRLHELEKRLGSTSALLGESPVMRQLRERVRLAASSNATVLVTGERGTGKELVARAIHGGSRRAAQPMEKLNCAAVPHDLIESELFGHEAGAFTGAARQRKGKFERAHQSTLFLDEVGDMPSAMQAKLLRVLQEGEVERVGGSGALKVDARVVAATNRDLPGDVNAGRFRADLYDRLNVVPVHIPPLRARREDVPMLLESFLPGSCQANDRAPKRLSQGALNLLVRYPFPGNVRELRNLVERLVILTPGDVIDEDDVRAALPASTLAGAPASGRDGYYTPGVSWKDLTEAVERDLLTRALEHHKGNATHAARDLGLERSHFYKKLRSLGIQRPGAQSHDDDDEG